MEWILIESRVLHNINLLWWCVVFPVQVLEYEYEQDMEEAYLQSLFKSFKKTVDDGFFPFIIVDAINEKVKSFEPFWSYAKSKGFQVSWLLWWTQGYILSLWREGGCTVLHPCQSVQCVCVCASCSWTLLDVYIMC